MHFVKDGHHRVSVARAQGLKVIDAHVTEVVTEVGAGPDTRPSELPLKSHERLFYERVPLPREARERIRLTDAYRYAGLAEGVEAWGFRLTQGRGEFMSRAEVAETWFREEYLPVVEALREADLIGSGTETEAYMRLTTLRYMLLRTHEWDDAVLDRLRADIENPSWDDDSLIRRLLREVK
jgi:hypothetical protein